MRCGEAMMKPNLNVRGGLQEELLMLWPQLQKIQVNEMK